MQILPRLLFEKILIVFKNLTYFLYSKNNFFYNKKNFPKESDNFKNLSVEKINKLGIFKDPKIFSLVAVHSAKSIGKNYETAYTTENIWIKNLYGYNCSKLTQVFKFISK